MKLIAVLLLDPRSGIREEKKSGFGIRDEVIPDKQQWSSPRFRSLVALDPEELIPKKKSKSGRELICFL